MSRHAGHVVTLCLAGCGAGMPADPPAFGSADEVATSHATTTSTSTSPSFSASSSTSSDATSSPPLDTVASTSEPIPERPFMEDYLAHGRIESICAPAYGPFFKEVAAELAPLCDQFIPR